MRKLLTAAVAIGLMMVLGATDTMAAGSQGNGTGNFFSHYYQWLRDDDGDGIPNCVDPDWTKPEDGTGYGVHNGDGDCDGDGIFDRVRQRLRDRLNEGEGEQHRYTKMYRKIIGE